MGTRVRSSMLGTDSVHTAHGITAQEVLPDDTNEHGGSVPVVPLQPRTRVKSGNFGHQGNSDAHFQTVEITMR